MASVYRSTFPYTSVSHYCFFGTAPSLKIPSSMFLCSHISSFDSSRIPSMASSSTSSVPKSFKYDVFLSFRGVDTRNTIVDHLYTALRQKGIDTYKDYEKIKKGERIRDDLFKSIEESRFYIIIFSKNYASSSWCLDELVKIMECQRMTEHTAYPIFYHVEPTEVRKQSGTVGEAFAEHVNKEGAGKWRDALEDASNLAGWGYKNDGENKFIQQIVHVISLELRSFNFSVDEKLVGMETRINKIVSSLETSSNDVRMLGIMGMGGAGKTTLARAVYDKISFLFEGKSFVENVRKVSNLSGLKALQKQIISDVLNDQGITVSNVFDGKERIRKSMSCRKVIVVLDDVDRVEQLQALAGDCNWFKPGSRIIITTRDKQVLQAHRVLFHDVTLLSEKEAICLLSRYAFGTETPGQGYEELSSHVISYASGLPLTIKVLGSKLCGEDECIWRDVIERLKQIPLKETQKQLEISYYDLEDDHREIFLDVACIMKGWSKANAIRVLDSCGRHGGYGLRVLELKSLITINRYKGWGVDDHIEEILGMHDHIEEMGRNIVRHPYHDKPHTHSRLWKDEEIEEILAKDLGTEATCIKMTLKTNSNIDMKGFRKMKNLRFLHLSNNYDSWGHQDEVSQYFPDALRCLIWESYPFRCLPNTFRAKNLVRIEMPECRSQQLWKSGGKEVLDKLKFLMLDDSNLRTLDLGVTPNLEMLSLKYSRFLEELHMPNKLQKLKSVILTHSDYLKSFDFSKTPNLETLDLEGIRLEECRIPAECPKLISLGLWFKNFKSFDLGKNEKLETLRLKECGPIALEYEDDHISDECHLDFRRLMDLKELRVFTYENDSKSYLLHMPNELQKLKSLSLKHPTLRTLDIGGRTPNLEGRDAANDNHMAFKCPNLQSLYLDCSKLEIVSLERASKLKSLNIIGSKNLETLDLSQAVNLKELKLSKCQDLVKLDMPVILSKLKTLSIYCPKLGFLDLGFAPNLEYLYLGNYCDLVVHMHVWLPKLKSLYLNLPKLRTLDFATPNLETLNLGGCEELVLKMPLKFPKLKIIQLSCSMLKTLTLQTPSLEYLDLGGCFHLIVLVMLGDYPMLKGLLLSEKGGEFTLIGNIPDNVRIKRSNIVRIALG